MATVITVPPGGSAEADAILKPMRGARVSGTLVERGTGVPLTSGCYSVHLYEASGIDMGWIIPVDDFGRWHTYKLAPAGRWTALAQYTTGQFDSTEPDGIIDLDCGTSPAHLDTWYHGASGWPLFRNSLVAHGATFPSAATFGVAPGVPVDEHRHRDAAAPPPAGARRRPSSAPLWPTRSWAPQAGTSSPAWPAATGSPAGRATTSSAVMPATTPSTPVPGSRTSWTAVPAWDDTCLNEEQDYRCEHH